MIPSMSCTGSFLGTFLPFPASRNVWSSGLLISPSPLISLLQLSHGTCSGIPLTFQICTHKMLAEVLLFFSNTIFSFLLHLGEELSSLKNRENWRNHVEVLLCWEVLMGVVSQFLTSSSASEVASPGKQPVPGSLYSPPQSSWKLLGFLATNACNTTWSFWVLHLIHPKIIPRPQAEKESSRYSEFSLFNNNKKKAQCFHNNLSYQTYIFKDIISLKKH